MNIKLKKIFFLISKIIGINIGFPIISKNIVKLQDDDKNINKCIVSYFLIGIMSFFLTKTTNKLLISQIIVENIHHLIVKNWREKYSRNLFLYSLCSLYFLPIYFKNSKKIYPSYRYFLSSSMNNVIKKNYIKLFILSIQASIPYIIINIFKGIFKNKLCIIDLFNRLLRSSSFIFIISNIMKSIYFKKLFLGNFLCGTALVTIEHPSQLDRIVKFVWSHTFYSLL